MDPKVTYHKSAKGLEEIASRTYRLSPRLRSMLILIDGRRSFTELSKLTSAIGEPFELLSQLLDNGFIEADPAAELAAVTVPGGLADAPPGGQSFHSEATIPMRAVPLATPPGPPRSLQDARRYAVHHLTDLMGSNADMLCIKIESATGLTEFITAIMRAQDVLRNVRGAAAAEKFALEMAERMPLE